MSFIKQRIFIEKRAEFQHENQALQQRLKQLLHLEGEFSLRILESYDVFHLPEEQLSIAIEHVFSDPVSDLALRELPAADWTLAVEPLPGQFDQRADSAQQCLQLLHPDFADTRVTSARVYLFKGALSERERQNIALLLINPIESREKNMQRLEESKVVEASAVPILQGFIRHSPAALAAEHQRLALAMSLDDLAFIQSHFQSLGRDPSLTELRVLDTYWSDHCRHTTFETRLENITLPQSPLGKRVQVSLNHYHDMAAQCLPPDAPLSLMKLATIHARYARQQGNLQDLELSDEINACSVFVPIEVDGSRQSWLLQFKNETHNHPTEVEPYGGASTCLGGAIRDPLAGRAYVYQAIRLSGSADPREALEDTLPGKLPQRMITQGAAAGYSAYGNQIGIATTLVHEFYHPDYKAKRMEVGAVVGAVPAENVQRRAPQAGDLVILIGGRTGRDGCGGATGSSKQHDEESLHSSAAEVQKGNAPTERKIQRLFRNPVFAKRIKKCNDFGAGGVAVAVGELAASLRIDLDAVPVKYQGLDGTELAISESQERMAIVIDPADRADMLAMAHDENLEATVIAEVTDDGYLSMFWRGERIVHLQRRFLDSNGVPAVQHGVIVEEPDERLSPFFHKTTATSWAQTLRTQLCDLNTACQRGLGDRFDSSVGAGSVLLPYGGRYQLSPAEASVHLFPAEGETQHASALAYGFNPYISAWSPYHGGCFAVLEAYSRLIAVGVDPASIYFSFQEYFRRLGKTPQHWGLPFAALLGAGQALSALNKAAIGGKDSMSGSFNDLHVPPTLIAFAVGVLKAQDVISSEFKGAGQHLYLLHTPLDNLNLPDWETYRANVAYMREVHDRLQQASSIRQGGLIQSLFEAACGNRIGINVQIPREYLFAPAYGSFLISSTEALPKATHLIELGQTIEKQALSINHETQALEPFIQQWLKPLHSIFPLDAQSPKPHALWKDVQDLPASAAPSTLHIGCGKPRVCIPVFPGMNSEYDTARAFKRVGGLPQEVLFLNQNAQDIAESIEHLAQNIAESQIIALCGGFSAADEPDGSGKFIANVLKNKRIQDAILAFLARDGLILGICNGFQALIKTGLLPYGEFRPRRSGMPTLAVNSNGRHVARMAMTRIVNNRGPWLQDFAPGERHLLAFSHGEGRFTASDAELRALIEAQLIASQYINPQDGLPSMHAADNPNGSLLAVEGIINANGHIFGKMGHSERYQSERCYRNHPDAALQDIFRNGVSACR